MEKELISPVKELNTIKLIRGQRNTYGWELKFIGEDENEILERIKLIDEELVKSHTELNLKEDK